MHPKATKEDALHSQNWKLNQIFMKCSTSNTKKKIEQVIFVELQKFFAKCSNMYVRYKAIAKHSFSTS